MNEIETRIKRVIAEQIGVDVAHVSGDKAFLDDLGCDSLDDIEIVMALEDEFSIELSDEDAEKCRTVQQAIDLVLASDPS